MRGVPDPERFMAAIAVDPESGCWNWTGYLKPDGYGQFWWKSLRRSLTVQQASHLLFKGPIPEGYHVDHLCRNKRCGNPEHLEAVTPAENNRRRNAVRTTCKWGHPLTDENTQIYVRKDGQVVRKCRPCGRRKVQRHAPYEKKGLLRKVSERDIEAIRARRARGERLGVIAADFGIAQSTVCRIAGPREAVSA